MPDQDVKQQVSGGVLKASTGCREVQDVRSVYLQVSVADLE